MKKKKCLVLTFILGFLFGTVACGKDEVIFKENNAIFTESFYEEVTEIEVWNGDTKYVIDDEEKCRKVIALFSALTLTEKTVPELNNILIGGMRVEFIMKDGSTEVTASSTEISIDSVHYEVDEDIIAHVRKIAMGKAYEE